MANYPSALSTNATLYIAVNGLQTTLAVACTSGDTTLTLTSTTGFPTTGLVTIDNTEVVSYTGIAGATITGCTRGADGTTAASHLVGVTVGATIVAAHHNLLKDEIIAIEAALGTNLSNVFPATPTTGSGNVVLATSPTLVTPNLGTPSAVNLANATNLPNSATTATPNATASTIMSRDANVNVKINEMVENFSTTATAAGTTTLTAASSPLQQFTGTLAQTVVLPDATTLSVGFYFTVMNRSTGAVTVNKNGGTLQVVVAASTQATFVVTSIGTAAGVWDTSTSSGGSATAYREDYVVGTALNNYTGSLTVFNLVTPYNVGGHSLVVTLDGDVQTIGATIDYQETNSTTVTFNNSLVSGQKVSFIFQTATSSGGTVNSGTSGRLAYYPSTGPTVSEVGADASMGSHKITSLSNGTAASDAAAFGQINTVQTVVATSTTSFSTSSTSYQSTNLSASITMSNSAHKIRITVSGTGQNDVTINGFLKISLFRDSTDLAASSADGITQVWNNTASVMPVAFIFTDSPGDTSAHTYTVKIKVASSGTVYFSPQTQQQTIILEEVLV